MSQVAPLVLSAIVCDRVIIDAATKSPSIIHVIHSISAIKYPARHPRMAFFFELTNGHGQVELSVRLVDIEQDEKVIVEGRGRVKFANVRQVIANGLHFDNIILPHPGEYCFQLYADSELLAERRFTCLQVKPGPRKKQDPGPQT
jgi:hypothetical protein